MGDDVGIDEPTNGEFMTSRTTEQNKARDEVLDSVNAAIDECNLIIEAQPGGFVLINTDSTLCVIETSDGLLRLGSITNPYISTHRSNALKAATRWNNNLNSGQKKAGCGVRVLSLCEAATEKKDMLHDLIKQLEQQEG